METFNEVYDKIIMEDLSPELQKVITESSESITYTLDKHMKDKIVHISRADRTTWNNKAPNESPNFTGTPTAPTPNLGDSSTKIATTEFVNNTVKIYRPEISNKANKLANKVNITIGGLVGSTTTAFDGSSDIIIPINSVDTSALKGTIPPKLLTGKYPISISGNATHAETADRISGIELNQLAPIDSPTLKGLPTAPTATFGTATTQIATTEFVDKAVKGLTVSNSNKFNPFKLKVTGKATAPEVKVDGTSNVTLNITNLDLDYKAISSNITVDSVNGHKLGKDVPADAKFTDTVYVHPNTKTDLTNTEFTTVTVDRQGHVIAARNPSNLDVNISKNAATATKLQTARKLKFKGLTAADVAFDGSSDVNIDVTAIPAKIITETDDKQFISKKDKDKLSTVLSESQIDAKISKIQVGSSSPRRKNPEIVPIIDWNALANKIGKPVDKIKTDHYKQPVNTIRVYDADQYGPDGKGGGKILLKQKWAEFDEINFVFFGSDVLCDFLIPTWRLKRDLELTNTDVMYGPSSASGGTTIGGMITFNILAFKHLGFDDKRVSTEDSFYIATNAYVYEIYGINY